MCFDRNSYRAVTRKLGYILTVEIVEIMLSKNSFSLILEVRNSPEGIEVINLTLFRMILFSSHSF